MEILIVGAGLFGLTGALELRRRGHEVRVLDPGPVPHPDSASNDVSKVVRVDYGSDELYTELAERSVLQWPEWNERLGEEVYRNTGVLLVARGPLSEAGFEGDSLRQLRSRGHSLDILDATALSRAHPAWQVAPEQEAYLNPAGGWVASGRCLALLAELCLAEGVQLVEGARFEELVLEGDTVRGVACENGRRFAAERVIVAAGAWTPTLLPWLADRMWSTAQSVLHFQVEDRELFTPPGFPVWAADAGRTGWYGFPALADGRLKVANHGPGRPHDPATPRQFPDEDEERFRAFVSRTFPSAAEAPVAEARVCLYCDSFDGDFWIDADPERQGLSVAAGGSGHAFKFLPVLGELVADACEGREGPERFRWRARGEGRPVDAMRSPGV